MEKVVRKLTLKSKNTDFDFWQSKSEVERLEAIETLRQQYFKFKYADAQPRFQRVYQIIKRS